jgi:hypothetical protein
MSNERFSCLRSCPSSNQTQLTDDPTEIGKWLDENNVV